MYAKISFKSSLKCLLREFLQRSYINGLQLLLLPTPAKYAKTLWIAFLASIVLLTHVVIVNLTFAYIEQPTEIHMSPNLVHVANSPFPAVGVCSANKISKSKVLDYAGKIFQHQEIHNPQLVANNTNEMAQKLLVLVNFYVNPFDVPKFDSAVLKNLDVLLISYHNSSLYSINAILRQLAPDCKSMVLRGIIFGQRVNTSELFFQRSTSSSVCCMFNYRRPRYSFDPETRAHLDAENVTTQNVTFESNSILNSVQFVLQDDLEDSFTYTSLSNTAFQILIFPQKDYATIQSNTLGEILVDHNTIVEIPIQPKFFGSRKNVGQVSPKQRMCYFPEEGQKLINQSYYSLDECLLICRIESMMHYCGCVSSTMAGTDRNVNFCTFSDLPCLMQWKWIWYGYDTFFYVTDELRKLKATFQQCNHCLPTCNGVNFKIYTNTRPLRQSNDTNGYSHGLLKGLTNKRPLAIIKLFFKQRYAQATEMNTVGDWVVLLNRFGGILSLMYGFSIISLIEILYFLTGKWFIYFHRRFNSKQRVDSLDSAYKIYWKELYGQKH